MDTQEYKAKRNIVVHFLHYCIHVVKSKSESDLFHRSNRLQLSLKCNKLLTRNPFHSNTYYPFNVPWRKHILMYCTYQDTSN